MYGWEISTGIPLIKEIQTKTTVRHHLTSVTTIKIKKTDQTRVVSLQGNGTLIQAAGNAKGTAALGKSLNSLEVMCTLTIGPGRHTVLRLPKRNEHVSLRKLVRGRSQQFSL